MAERRWGPTKLNVRYEDYPSGSRRAAAVPRRVSESGFTGKQVVQYENAPSNCRRDVRFAWSWEVGGSRESTSNTESPGPRSQSLSTETISYNYALYGFTTSRHWVRNCYSVPCR